MEKKRSPTYDPLIDAHTAALLGRGISVFEIHDFISGDFEPVPLPDVWDDVKAQEAGRMVTLTLKPAGKQRRRSCEPRSATAFRGPPRCVPAA